jgi:hypothetical protein
VPQGTNATTRVNAVAFVTEKGKIRFVNSNYAANNPCYRVLKEKREIYWLSDYSNLSGVIGKSRMRFPVA